MIGRAVAWAISGILCGATLVAVADVGAAARTSRIGRRAALSGTLTVLQEDDFAAGRTARHYFLEDRIRGRRYSVRFENAPTRALRTGDRVTLRGRVLGSEVVVAESGELVVTEAAAAMTGERKALVMIVDFQDEAVSCSDSAITDSMFTGTQSVDGLYQETSFGAVSFPGDTDGVGGPDVLRVSISALTTSGSCDSNSWAADADSEATSAGVNLNLYQHRVYVLPGGAPCGWAGLANVGCGTYCRAWIKTCHLPDVYAHELGHNLALRHASTDEDNDGTQDCEYCDTSDFMGYGGPGWRQINGAHKHQMGWLAPGQLVEVTPAAPQNYVLAPLEVNAMSTVYPQVLKISTSGGYYYYLTYRRRIGYDATLSSNYNDKLNIHRSSDSGSGNSWFIDALIDGETLQDAAGVSVTQVSHDNDTVTLILEDITVTCSDNDGDGFGVPGSPSCSSGSAEDCDDSRSDVYPGAPEICDQVDNNCDLQVDEGVQSTWYLDADDDGYGDSGQTLQNCDPSPPEGYSANGSDCDDTAWNCTLDCSDADSDGTPDCLTQADELGADFGTEGLWHFETGGWSELSPWDPMLLARWGNDLAADFGPGRGLWRYDGAAWQKLSSWDSYALAEWGSDVVAAFDNGRGLWLRDATGWSRLTSWEPTVMEPFGGRLAAEFGPGRGLWLHDGAGWSKISDLTAEALEAAGTGASFDLAIDFGGNGLSVHDGVGLLPLTPWDPLNMTAWNDELVVEFGAGRGLWSYGAAGWVRLTPWDSYALTVWGDRLVAAFDGGRGLWLWNGSSWTKLSPWEPVEMVEMGRHLAVGFDAGRGLWLYDIDTGWTRITSWDPQTCESLDLH